DRYGIGNRSGHYRSARRENLGEEPSRRRRRILLHIAFSIANMNTATILVVDDEPQLRRAMRATLTSMGYTVIEAKTGEEAIEKFGTEAPELVLLDLNMPGIGGLETCRAL